MKKHRGFTIFEVTIAFFCLVLIAVPVAGVMIGQVRNQNDVQKGVVNQQETARLVTRLTDDLRFSKLGIAVSSEDLLVIHYDENRFITYRYQGTPYIQRWESSTLSGAEGAPAQNCTLFPDSSSGTSLEGGKFQYFDKSNVPLPYNKDQNKICAISLSGAKLGGSQGGSQVSIAIPPLTVANRYAIEAMKKIVLEGGPAQWHQHKDKDEGYPGLYFELTIPNPSNRTMRFNRVLVERTQEINGKKTFENVRIDGTTVLPNSQYEYQERIVAKMNEVTITKPASLHLVVSHANWKDDPFRIELFYE